MRLFIWREKDMCSIMGYRGSAISRERFKECFDRTISRGPDMQRINQYDSDVILGFERLAIMGLHEEGMQPFELNGRAVVCNGEIYGFRPIKKELEKEYSFVSDSDCEVLLPLYEKYGLEMFAKLDAEYACIIYDPDRKGLVAARDPIGIRPLFYGYCADGSMVFASEAKNLVGLVDKVTPFPPGYYWADGKFTCYRDMTKVEGGYHTGNTAACEAGTKDEHPELAGICRNIREKLTAGIEKRLDADAPLGFLLSGGLDSSLVCAVSTKILNKPIRTFAIGMSTDAIDLKYAKEVADYIGSEHTEVIITSEDVVNALPEVIALQLLRIGNRAVDRTRRKIDHHNRISAVFTLFHVFSITPISVNSRILPQTAGTAGRCTASVRRIPMSIIPDSAKIIKD